MLDIKTLEKIDSQQMFRIYEKWPELAKKNYQSGIEKIRLGKISHIVFAGMGGSGTIGDIFASILSKTKIHVEVVKGYRLPTTVNSNSLVVIVSVSGNTDETFNVLLSAYKSKCKIIAFSDGGRIYDFCRKKRIEHRKISMIHSPRASLPIFLFSIIKILEPFLPIKKNDVLKSLKDLESTRKIISVNNLTKKNSALTLAKWISDIPLIYYPAGLQPTANRFKNCLQENAKIHVITDDVIEACHNGIVGWEKKSNVKPILIQGTNDNKKTKERWNILKQYFEEKNIEYTEVFSNQGNILTKIINLIYFFDYTTIYKAVLNGTDPTPVDSITYIKNKLNPTY